MKPTDRYRVCAVCGRRHGVTYGFRTILLRMGIATPADKKDKAVKECVIKAAQTWSYDK
jgi:hypothetical protein